MSVRTPILSGEERVPTHLSFVGCPPDTFLKRRVLFLSLYHEL